MRKTQTKNLSEYPKHFQNPFVKNLVIKKRDKTVSFSRGLTLKDSDTDKEYETQMIHIRRKVDNEQFIKLFNVQLKAILGLSDCSLKVFMFMISYLQVNNGEVFFDYEQCLEITAYRSHDTVYRALAELIANGMIARTKYHNKYFINPEFVFNGDRLVIVNDYLKMNPEDEKNAKKAIEQYRDEIVAAPSQHDDWTTDGNLSSFKIVNNKISPDQETEDNEEPQSEPPGA